MSTLPKHSSTSEGAKPALQSESEYEEPKVPLDEEKAMEIVSKSNDSPEDFSQENFKVNQTEIVMESTICGHSCYPEKEMNM